jgi:hypothetical protein
MDVRARDIVLLVVLLAVVAGAAVAGYAVLRTRAEAGPIVHQAFAPVPMPTRASPGATAAPDPQYERWTVGVARRPVTVREHPASGSATLEVFGKHTAAGDYPTLFLVDSVREVDGEPWYKVYVPAPPNGTKGWVRDGQLAFYSTAARIVVDLSERKLTVYKRGSGQGTWPVAVGRPGLSTPTGTYFVTMKLRPPDPGGAYGVLALGTSAYQPKLSDWAGGGIVGIHGTNEPWLIGKAISHGCVRMKNKDILEVSRLVPAGSPIFIQK